MTNNVSTRSVLRWVGNKSSLAPLLASYAPLRYLRYLEPFAGSAALFSYLKPQRAILGDKNHLVVNLYKFIKEQPIELYMKYSTLVKKDNYYTTRKYLNDNNPSTIDSAAAFLYLNRTCFNGVFRTNQAGMFNVPSGRRIGPALALGDILHFHQLLQQVQLHCGDYQTLIQIAKPGDFLYLDPPYFHHSKRFRGEYGSDSFTEADLVSFAAACEELIGRQCYVMISYKHTPEAQLLFQGWNYRTLQTTSRLNRTSALNNAFEALITNY